MSILQRIAAQLNGGVADTCAFCGKPIDVDGDPDRRDDGEPCHENCHPYP